MSTDQDVKIDERTVAVAGASTRWAYNFLFFALTVDILYRVWVYHEVVWDLIALVGVSGAIGMVNLARHKVLNWPPRNRLLIGFVIIIVGAVMAAIVGMIHVK